MPAERRGRVKLIKVAAEEICGSKTPMGVKVRVRGFRSPEAAEVAGKTALAEFLEGLLIEDSSSV
jgi:hypothetical protein